MSGSVARTGPSPWRWLAAGLLAGGVNGLFGGGGGLLLLPLLLYWLRLEEREAFASSLAVLLPVSVVSAFFYWRSGWLTVEGALPYLLGGLAGGCLGGRCFPALSTRLLRLAFALFLLWGGVRCFL